MTTDTRARGELAGYPCPSGGICYLGCSHRYECVVLPIYDAHIALRTDMRKLRAAVLGGLPPEVAAYVYRNAAQLYGERANEDAKARFMALADVVEGL